jgi:hypothetical protein
MATFNFHGDNRPEGNQYIVGRDLHITASSPESVLRFLAVMQAATESEISAGRLPEAVGRRAVTEISGAIDALEADQPDGARHARASLARAREILVTAALVPGLAEGIAQAIDAIKKMA